MTAFETAGMTAGEPPDQSPLTLALDSRLITSGMTVFEVSGMTAFETAGMTAGEPPDQSPLTLALDSRLITSGMTVFEMSGMTVFETAGMTAFETLGMTAFETLGMTATSPLTPGPLPQGEREEEGHPRCQSVGPRLTRPPHSCLHLRSCHSVLLGHSERSEESRFLLARAAWARCRGRGTEGRGRDFFPSPRPSPTRGEGGRGGEGARFSRDSRRRFCR